MGKKRLGELSFMNVILCIMTVFIHIISYPVSHMDKSVFLYDIITVIWRLSVIVVPGFIMLASCKLFMKISKSEKFEYGKYYVGRLKRLIVPYIFWFALYYALFMYVYGYELEISFISKHFFLGSLVYHLYFIPILVQFDVLIPLWKKIVKHSPAIIILPIALIFTIICESGMANLVGIISPGTAFKYNDRLFTSYLIYWMIGAYMGSNYDAFKNMIVKNKITVCVIFIFTMIINVIFSDINYTGKGYISNMNLIHMAYVLSALMFLFMISIMRGEKFTENFRIVSVIDRLSYRIYLSHVLVLLAVDYAILKLNINVFPATALRILVVYPVTIFVCMIVEKMTHIKITKKVNEKIKKGI
ncbi:MAG: acyltransferase [Ruminococcaceae bacterium]|nr:acyltransferase [Oscillospiraceae bacterium]